MITQKKYFFLLLFVSYSFFLFGQANRKISIEQCMEQAILHHPIYQQHQLQSKRSDYVLRNYQNDLYPSVAVSGKASWQNEVTSFPIAFPGISIPAVSKDQYRLSVDLSQPVYRGGLLQQQIEMEQNALALANLQTDKELYAIKMQTKNLFFQVLILDKQQRIIRSYQEILQQKFSELAVFVQEGVALESGLDVLKLELIISEQDLLNITNMRSALIQNLNEFTQLEMSATDEFLVPLTNDLPVLSQDRFEYHLLRLQQKQIETAKNMINTKAKPMVFAFATAGYGRPGFNLLSNNFADFYMFGLSLKWDLWDWNQNRTEMKILDINSQLIETQKQSFDLNIQLAVNQIQVEIENQKAQLKKDPEIIALRANVLKTAEAQFKNGNITGTDYIVELQKMNQAKLNFELHQIALINSQLTYMEILGKL